MECSTHLRPLCVISFGQPDNKAIVEGILFHDPGEIRCAAISLSPVTREIGDAEARIYELLGVSENPTVREVPVGDRTDRRLRVLLADPTSEFVRTRARRISGLYRKNYAKPIVRTILAWARFQWTRSPVAHVSDFDLRIMVTPPQYRMLISGERASVACYRWFDGGEDAPFHLFEGADRPHIYNWLTTEFEGMWDAAKVPGNLADGHLCTRDHLARLAKYVGVSARHVTSDRELLRLICVALGLGGDYEEFRKARKAWEAWVAEEQSKEEPPPNS